MTNAVEIASAPIPENEPIPDPFSSDLFLSNGKAKVSDSAAEPIGTDKRAVEQELNRPASWAARLPKVSRKLLERPFWDEKFPAELPDLLSKAIADALGEVVFAESGRVSCRLESLTECDLFAESADLARAGNLTIQIVFEPTQSYAAVMVGGSFVHRITDKIFGPSGYESSNRISPIEMAIAEFLAARAVAHINDSLGNEVFSVGEVSLMPTELFSEHEVGAKACLAIQGEVFSQLFPVLISRGGIKNIGGIFDPEPDQLKTAKLFRAIRSIPLRAQIGSTRLDSATLSFLEPGDIVIVEESQLDWNHGSPKGELRLFAGAGTNFVLTGALTTNVNPERDGMRVLVKDISSREAVNDDYTARLIMEDKKTVNVELEDGSQVDEKEEIVEPQENNEVSAAVENLQLRLRVELAGSRMSLSEINNLRVGQVIDLGRGPNDSVSLITDGSDETVATGELVDIDGSLGVRLTKVFL